jgi:hypothetical protein
MKGQAPSGGAQRRKPADHGSDSTAALPKGRQMARGENAAKTSWAAESIKNDKAGDSHRPSEGDKRGDFIDATDEF